MKKYTFLFPFILSTNIIYGATEKPNIIIFLVDDMGLMDTSVPFITDGKGNAQVYPLNNWYHTINMERMAQQGVRFSHFYAQSLSSPSRASLITGQTSARHGVTNWINAINNNKGTYGPNDWSWNGVDPQAPLLPKVLKENGYKTIHIGKSHLGRIGSPSDQPTKLGYDVQVGYAILGPHSYLAKKSLGYNVDNDSFYPCGLEKYKGKDLFLTEILTIEAKKQIKQAQQEKKPFYLYLSHYAVHAPFCTDQKYVKRYENQDKADKAISYATMIEGMDRSLGDIFDYLNETGIAENTLVLFIGDNGSDAPLGEPKGYTSSSPLRGKKGTEYEGGVRVPFMACWGKRNPQNKFQKQFPIGENIIQEQMGTIMDIYPTLLSLLHIEKPKNYNLDGYSLKTQLTGKINEARKNTFLMHFPHEHWGNYFTTYLEDNWKLIYYYNPEIPNYPFCELYDLSKDPFEVNNLATTHSIKLKEMVTKMAAELETMHACYPVDNNGNKLKPHL